MTKHEAALMALEEAIVAYTTAMGEGPTVKGRPFIAWERSVENARRARADAVALHWPTIRDALTAQGEALTSVHVVMREGPFPIKAVHDSRAGAEADAAMRGEDYEVETWRIQRADPAPSAPHVPYTTPCFECEGRGFTRRYVDGARESDKCSWCHGGGVVPSAPPARRDE